MRRRILSLAVLFLLAACGETSEATDFDLRSGVYEHVTVETHARECAGFPNLVPEEGDDVAVIAAGFDVDFAGEHLLRTGNDLAGEREDNYPGTTSADTAAVVGCTLTRHLSIYGTIPKSNALVMSVESTITGHGAPCDQFGDLPCSDVWFMQLERVGDLPE